MKNISLHKRIIAIGSIFLLLLIYLIALLAGIFDQTSGARIFQACLFSTIGVPILAWIYIWIFGQVTKKHTMADFDLSQSKEIEESASESASNDAPDASGEH